MPDADDRRLSLRVVTLPRDTNQYGTIFGGVILSLIDQAAFLEARRHGAGGQRWVTVAMDKVVFKQPVHVGDAVSLLTRTIRMGRTSVTVAVEVEAERYETGATVPVTEATMTMVAVDTEGRPTPFAPSPPLDPRRRIG
jgi:acyl-CoA thioesterase YciA